jgi:hypothetical protein
MNLSAHPMTGQLMVSRLRPTLNKINSSPNRSHLHLLTRNCADFAKEVINLSQPKALHRSYVADLGISTPKQMAKSLVQFSQVIRS